MVQDVTKMMIGRRSIPSRLGPPRFPIYRRSNIIIKSVYVVLSSSACYSQYRYNVRDLTTTAK
jgi:hypothetical protein